MAKISAYLSIKNLKWMLFCLYVKICFAVRPTPPYFPAELGDDKTKKTSIKYIKSNGALYVYGDATGLCDIFANTEKNSRTYIIGTTPFKPVHSKWTNLTYGKTKYKKQSGGLGGKVYMEVDSTEAIYSYTEIAAYTAYFNSEINIDHWNDTDPGYTDFFNNDSAKKFAMSNNIMVDLKVDPEKDTYFIISIPSLQAVNIKLYDKNNNKITNAEYDYVSKFENYTEYDKIVVSSHHMIYYDANTRTVTAQPIHPDRTLYSVLNPKMYGHPSDQTYEYSDSTGMKVTLVNDGYFGTSLYPGGGWNASIDGFDFYSFLSLNYTTIKGADDEINIYKRADEENLVHQPFYDKRKDLDYDYSVHIYRTTIATDKTEHTSTRITLKDLINQTDNVPAELKHTKKTFLERAVAINPKLEVL